MPAVLELLRGRKKKLLRSQSALRTKHLRPSLNVIGAISFCEAIEYTVIVPTLFGYTKSFGASAATYSACFAAFSMTTTLVRLPFGLLAHRFGYRTSYLLSIGVAVVGNLLYLLAPLAPTDTGVLQLIFLGRLLAGFLGASQSLMNGYISEVTAEEPERTIAMLSTFNAIKMVGICIGPLFTCVFQLIDFSVGGFAVDNRNSPGLGLAVVLAGLAVASYCVVQEPDDKRVKFQVQYGSVEEPEPASTVRWDLGPTDSTNQSDADPAGDSPVQCRQDRVRSVDPAERVMRHGVSEVDFMAVMQQRAGEIGVFTMTIGRMVAVLDLFLLFFSIGSLESMVTPICKVELGFSSVDVSIMIGMLTGVLVATSFLMNWLSTHGVLSDNGLLLVGTVTLAISELALMTLPEKPLQAWQFVLPIAVYEMSFPFLNAPARGLMNKMCAFDPACTQGLLGLVTGLGQMLGPFWFSVAGSLYNTASGIFCGAVVLLVMQLTFLNRLAEIHDKPPPPELDSREGRRTNIVAAPMGFQESFTRRSVEPHAGAMYRTGSYDSLVGSNGPDRPSGPPRSVSSTTGLSFSTIFTALNLTDSEASIALAPSRRASALVGMSPLQDEEEQP